MNTNDLPYRPCVGICLINKDRLVFAGERLDNPGCWQMPQGGIDEGEDIVAAAKRELLEETGTGKIEIIGFYPEKLPYKVPAEIRANYAWGKTYKGQIQDWVYARFIGEDSDINLAAFDPPEFGRWAWMTPEDIKSKIIKFKIPTYDKVFGYLRILLNY